METQGRLNFFVDILNFNEEFCPKKQQWAENLSIILFCNTKDTTDRINVMYKKRPYRLINITIRTRLIDADLKAIEKEIKTWYNADE